MATRLISYLSNNDVILSKAIIYLGIPRKNPAYIASCSLVIYFIRIR